MTNPQIRLARRPRGWVAEDDLALVEVPVAEAGPGEVLVRNIYLSCDPYLRGRMDGAFAIGEVVPVRAVGEVVESHDPKWHAGDLVWGFMGWEQWSVVRGADLRRADPELGPISHYISVLGMPGLTAWVGVMELARPTPGETVLMSSAAGAVGSVAGQFARMSGARVVGSCGSADKIAHVTSTLGFDAAFDYHAEDLLSVLRQFCPDGIDVYFDNVGGALLEAVLRSCNPHARIPVCGQITRYNEVDDPGVRNIIGVLASRISMTGFSIYDHLHKLDEHAKRTSRWLRTGEITYTEDIHHGIENVPAAFIGMLRGDNIGKRLVQVAPDPTTPP